MKVVLVHIAFRIIGIVLLATFFFFLLFNDGGDWSWNVVCAQYVLFCFSAFLFGGSAQFTSKKAKT